MNTDEDSFLNIFEPQTFVSLGQRVADEYTVCSQNKMSWNYECT